MALQLVMDVLFLVTLQSICKKNEYDFRTGSILSQKVSYKKR